MIRYKIEARLDEMLDRTGRRPTFTDIEMATEKKVSVSVLSNMRRKRGYVTSTRIIDKLCKYFECQPGDLLEWRPDPEGE